MENGVSKKILSSSKKSIQEVLDSYKHLGYLPDFEIDGKPGLTGIDGSQVGDYVILTVRDPLCAYDEDPAFRIAHMLEHSELVAKTGMFITYSGYYKGAHISVVSGGSGSPEAELILLEFMMHSQARTYLRVGGAGAWSENVHPGDIVISSGVVRDEGMTRSYIVPQFPAVASHELVLALTQAASSSDIKYHVGITRSGDSEYCGWGKPAFNGYIQPEHTQIIDYYNRAGVLCADRESSAIITLTALFGMRGGSICSIGDSVVAREAFKVGAGHENAIKIGLDGLAFLHQMDMAKNNSGDQYWVPSSGFLDIDNE